MIAREIKFCIDLQLKSFSTGGKTLPLRARYAVLKDVCGIKGTIPPAAKGGGRN